MMKRKLRIMFTSVGRRVELLQEFRAAAEKLGQPLTIVGADAVDTAPALRFCDEILTVPRIKDPAYIPVLTEYCRDNKVDALIPTIDTDLLLLAQNKEAFSRVGTLVFISDEEVIGICRDKRKTADFFQSIGLFSPTPCDDYRKYEGGYPAFIKPLNGSSSVNAYKVNDGDELRTYAGEVPDYIVAPFIDGTEYTVDVFCNTDGTPVYITPRIRLAVRSGEVLKTEISLDGKMIDETRQIVRALKPCGAITIQLIRQNDTGNDYFIEINPRFGGGAPLSMKAGADSAGALLRILNGEKPEYIQGAAEDGAVYSRFDQSVRVK